MISRLLIALTLLFSASVFAENSQKFGVYTVHYSAFTADILTADIAKAYGIKRSKSTALINITLMKDTGQALPVAQKADVVISAQNLIGQKKNIKTQQILEKDAVYYLGETSVDHKERLSFDVKIYPEGTDKMLNVTFQHQFFTQ